MVYFLSDMHLGARYLPDPRAAEQRVVRFLRSIRHDATDLYLMGDALDYWFEYRNVVPRGFVRFFGALAELADAGVRIHWYIGNHDIWLFDYLRTEIGMEVVDGWRVEQILGSNFFLSHGDGVGELPFSFRLMRAIFRNRLCQRLFAAIHPRWTVGLAYSWSKSNRDFKHYETPRFEGLERNSLARFARAYLAEHPKINYFVFGHQHIATDEKLSDTCRFVLLGDWITQFTYAKFDGKDLQLCHFDT